MLTSLSASDAEASSTTTPCATCSSRVDSRRTNPQPRYRVPGSMPSTNMRRYGAITHPVPNRKSPLAQPTAAAKTVVTSGKIKSQLRALGHELQPVVQVGKTGLGPGVRQELEQALHAHELIKVRLLRECPIERKAAGKELALGTGAAHIQTLGSVVLLYRARPEKPGIVFSGTEVTQTKRSSAARKAPGGATATTARKGPGHAAGATARKAPGHAPGARVRQSATRGRSSPSGHKARRHSS